MRKLPRCKFCEGVKHPPKVRKHPAQLHWRADPYCSRKCLETDYAERKVTA